MSAAADLDALFRDPEGVARLRAIDPGVCDAALTPPAFHRRVPTWSSTAVGTSGLHVEGAGREPGARECALSAMAAAWVGAVARWRGRHAALRAERAGAATIAAADEIAFYRRLAVSWPADGSGSAARRREVAADAAQGATDAASTAALTRFARALIENGEFLYTFEAAVARLAEIGARIALSHRVLCATLPGGWVDATAGDAHDPVAVALRALRERHGDSLTSGRYRPIAVAAGERTLAFARGDDVLVAVAVGDHATGAGGWRLPGDLAGDWRDAVTGIAYRLPSRATLAGVLGPDGRAVLERVS